MAVIYEPTDRAKYLVSRGGRLRGATAWKQGLLQSLNKDNKTELREIVKQQIDKESGAI